MRFELFISRRYFKPKPRRTVLSLITLLSIAGVAIGVTALIVVIAVMAGFEADLKARIMGIEPHFVIDRRGAPIQNYEEVVAAVDGIPGVRAAWPAEEIQVILKADSRVTGAVLKGIDPSAAEKGLGIQNLSSLLSPAMPTNDASPPPLVLGRDLARSLGIIQGDTVFVVSPRGALAPVGFIPYMKRFVVVDFFQTGMYEYDGTWGFMRLADAQALARSQNTVGKIDVRVDSVLDAGTIKQRLAALGNGKFRLQDWKQLNRNLFSALKLEKAAMFITLALIILVATFSITSSLVMLVMEKTKDIAILRTLGSTGGRIRRIFVIQGMLIGTIGTASGVIAGSLLCYLQRTYQLIRLPGDVYYITALPVDLKMVDVSMVALCAMVICYIATLYPAHQASRFNPVEAIRYG